MNPKHFQSLADEIAALNAGNGPQLHEGLPPDEDAASYAAALDEVAAEETIDATLEGSLPAEQQEKPAKKQQKKKEDKSNKGDSDKSDDSSDSDSEDDQSDDQSNEKSEEEKQKEQEQKQKEEQLWVQFALANSQRVAHPEDVATYADNMLKEYKQRFDQNSTTTT